MAASAVGVGIAGTLAVSLLPGLEAGQHVAGQGEAERLGASAQAHGSAARPTSDQAQVPHPAGANAASALPTASASATPGPTGNSAASQSGPATVVLAYFVAINTGNWQAAWALGGDNLYPSLTALVDDNADVRSANVTIVSVSGNTVVARVNASGSPGFGMVHTQTFTVEKGMIMSRRTGGYH